MIRRFVIIILCNIYWLISFSQNPSYIRIGENELSGVDIYSITQDANKTIWMTSNRGIIRYDGYDYKFLSCNHLKAFSSFNIIQNSSGEIFSFNLFGQILKIEEDTVKIFLELPDSLVFSRYEMEIREDDALLLRSDKNILIHPSGDFELVEKDVPNSVYNSISKSKMQIYSIRESEKSNLYHTPNLFLLLRWDGEKMIEFPMDYSRIPRNAVSHMAYRSKNNDYWFTLRNGGLLVFDEVGRIKYNGLHILSNYQISGFLEDYEGNLWLTTLGKGILLIPNQKIISYADNELIRNNTIVFSKFHTYGSIYLGTENGNIFVIHRDGEVKELFDNGSVNIHFIEFYRNYILSNGGMTVEMVDTTNFISKSIGQIPAVKQTIKLNEKEFLFATNSGVYHIAIHQNQDLEMIQRLEVGRCNSILPINGKQDFIVATTKGIFRSENFQKKEIKYQGEKIISSSLTKNQSFIFFATTTDGIHLYKDGEFKKHLTTSNGLMSNRILSIKTSGDLLFIATDQGMQIYNIKLHKFILPELNTTINGAKILNFDVRGDELIVVTNKDVQYFSVKDIKMRDTPPFINFKSITVNGVSVNHFDNNSFKYDQNKFEFHFIGKSYGHKEKLHYKYRLLPLDETWEEADFFNNKTKYGSLGDGQYTFQVIAINQDGVESEIIEYHFIIAKPFWETWWFYTISILLIATAITLVWVYQLKRIRKKNLQEKELIGSKLTALKLQMNPHFIFNALNSIQDLILKQDTDNSYDYIVKFSNLVRMTLNYSDKDMILIEEEIDLLKLYLELENLRFTKDFHFSIDNQIEKDIRIPSMLLQPFVENSIKHGLLHREGEKNISIKFAMEDAVVCTIEDNGIGIEKSIEINKRKRKNHESISVKSIRKRIDILKEVYSSELGVEYVNLYDEKQEPAGTKVIIRIPYEDE